ncbi:hypothetical protein [Capnocytophaga catalasegens]|uniref:Site-specific DNA-methyltransferase (adenine-specific) n=1 Tax=Capnocytophaga catalasegens TaxID=1004260 RepID=A0AAV5AZM2_9FLAO|nr:hypothetical protein [Capnocytophaga catalasegens]GIZ15284.1 hypothetical protein RCZ03_12840 [Capnocytophaga catalasegens]GJM51218.1 hypothetical protein RCZ15_21910 [Capnocytophaga catalasegens]GJM53012.1 hypothetical protein RCZ16_13290 [Capnocytophaga catalasegens]
MKLSKERQKQTGAFYTPKIWADLAVEYMRAYLPLPLEYYTFYDPTAGEGVLLEALPENCEKYASTLEEEDVKIMQNKGIKAWQFDFLNDDIFHLPHRIFQAQMSNKLVVFMNPPYVKLPAEPKSRTQDVYSTNDSVECFYYRVGFELSPVFLCSFNKLDILQSPKMANFRWFFTNGRPLIKNFISNSKTWGLSGEFPIGFMMWNMKMTNEEYEQEMNQKMERWAMLHQSMPSKYTDPKDYKTPEMITKQMPTSDDIILKKQIE